MGIPRLGPVGGRIVEEVLVGLIDADTVSYRRSQQEWRPQKNTQRITCALIQSESVRHPLEELFTTLSGLAACTCALKGGVFHSDQCFSFPN